MRYFCKRSCINVILKWQLLVTIRNFQFCISFLKFTHNPE
nr:MAG TPA: hypothetical protein [Bacteriophage sp.]